MTPDGVASDPVPLTTSDRDFLTFDSIPADLDRAIVPLVEMAQPERAGDPVDIRPIGTAFVVGQLPNREALLVTAGHNLPSSVLANRGNLLAMFPKVGELGPKPALQGIIVTGVSMAETSSDVALLVAPLDDTVRMPAVIPIGLEVPQVGENCLALGYSEMAIGEPVDLNADALIRLSSSRGKIEEVHPSRRDSVKITFPSFRTDALYAHGMSGGPVVSVSCRAIGVVSACMESVEEGVPHTSYCALTAGLLELAVPSTTGTFMIAGLAEAGSVSIAGVPTVATRAEGKIVIAWPDAESPGATEPG